MKFIGVGLQLYAADADRFPLKLSDLWKEYVSREGRFVRPGSTKTLNGANDIDNLGDYAYVPGYTPTDLGDRILVYERVPGDKGRFALFLNGRVSKKPLNERDFIERLKQDGKKPEKPRGGGELDKIDLLGDLFGAR